MKILALILTISLFAAGLVYSAETTPERRNRKKSVENANHSGPVEIDNEYFRVLRNMSADAAANTNIGARVFVALTEVKIHGSKGDLSLKRGQIAVFRADDSYKPLSGEFL